MRFLPRKILDLLYGPEQTVYEIQAFQYGTWREFETFRSRIQAVQRVTDLRENFPRELWRIQSRKGRM